jgi:hypothetical protein
VVRNQLAQLRDKNRVDGHSPSGSKSDMIATLSSLTMVPSTSNSQKKLAT